MISLRKGEGWLIILLALVVKALGRKVRSLAGKGYCCTMQLQPTTVALVSASEKIGSSLLYMGCQESWQLGRPAEEGTFILL